MSTTDILFNSPALHSLKRDQLVKLCKVHSIKASGKNVELITRLKQHARTLPKDSPLSVASRNEEATIASKLHNGTTEEDQSTDDGGTGHQAWGHQMPQPGEQWEVAMESIPEMIEESSSQGTVSSLRTLDNGGSGEFGTRSSQSKSSTMSSSIKALASSFGLKRHNSSKSMLVTSSSSQSISSLPSASTSDGLAQHSLPYSSLPQASTVPQNDHFTLDPPMQSETMLPAADQTPLPGHSLRPGVPAPPNARLSLGLDGGAPSTASKEQQPTTTIRLISNTFNPPSYANYDASIGRTPKLKPFKTSFDLVMGSPTRPLSGSGYPGISLWPPEDPKDEGEPLYPQPSLELPSAPSATREDYMDTDADVPMPGSLSFPSPQTPTASTRLSASTKAVEPFIFGSPLPQHNVSNAQFKTAAASVLDEMNKRLQVDGVQGIHMDMISRLQSGAHADGVDPLIDREVNLMPKGSNMTEKFGRMHEEEFRKMEGIDGFSKRRGMLPKNGTDETKRLAIVKKRKSSVVSHGAGRDRFGRRVGGDTPGRLSGRVIVPRKKSRVLPGSFEEDDGGERGEDKKMEERSICAEPSDRGGKIPKKDEEEEEEEEERKRKEQQAIKRKLELNKAKRRSSAGVAGARGRVSVGKGGVLLKPQPKPSRFGFLSSAKSLVQNVFGRGKTAAPATIASSSLVVPSKVKKSVKVPPTTSRPTTAKSSGGGGTSSLPSAPASGARSPIPPFGPAPSTSTRSSLMSAAGTRINQNSLNIGKGNSVGGVSSVGTRSSFASSSKLSGTATGISAGSMGSKVLPDAAGRSSATRSTSLTKPSRLPSSRLLAPTASSLAKITRSPASGLKYAAGSIAASRIKTESGPGLLGMITNSPAITKGPFSPRPGGIFSKPLVSPTCIPTVMRRQEMAAPVAGGSKLNIHPTSDMGEVKDANGSGSTNNGSTRQRSLVMRKPHISRSKVIAKLASQRAATASGSSGAKVGGTPSRGGRVRSSLGAKLQRSSYGVKTPGGGRVGGGGDVMMSAKKRARQSEYARRKSRVEPINFGVRDDKRGDGNGRHMGPE